MKREMDDSEFLAQIGGGDLEALSLLIGRHRLALFRTAYGELQRFDDAQDAVAEAIVRVCRNAGRLLAVSKIVPWMHVIVRNEARRIRRRVDSRKETTEIGEYPALDSKAIDTVAIDVRQCLRRLPAEQARAMTLYYLAGMDVASVAVAVGRPVGTVKWMLSRGRSELAQIMEGYGDMENNQQTTANIAVLAAPSLAGEYRAELGDALRAAGWSDVHVVSDPDDLLSFTAPENGVFQLPPMFENCQLVVLDESIGTTSAFALLPLFAAARRRADFNIFLLLDAGKSPKERDAAVLSAYVSGVDMLLQKPFVTQEFKSFAVQARKGFPAGDVPAERL